MFRSIKNIFKKKNNDNHITLKRHEVIHYLSIENIDYNISDSNDELKNKYNNSCKFNDYCDEVVEDEYDKNFKIIKTYKLESNKANILKENGVLGHV